MRNSKIKWKAGTEMTADLFTKNLPGTLFEKHASEFVGRDEYHQAAKAKHSKKETSMPAVSKRFDAEYFHIWNELVGD